MKNLRLSLVIFLFGGFSIQSCRTACDQTINYYAKVPVYGHLEGLRSSFEIIAVQPMDTIESIVELPIGYFLLEKDKGIHVIDKAIPSAPKLTSFIKLPGILSIAGNGSTLYVGQATDLVVLNVSDLNAITKQDVHKSLFNLEFMKADSFIVSYKYELVKWVIEDGRCADSYIYPEEISQSTSTSFSPNIDLFFQIDHLYGCDNTLLKSFKVGTVGELTQTSSQSVGFQPINMAKISASDSDMVVGHTTGNLVLYDLTSGRDRPIQSGFVFSPFTCGNFFVYKSAIFYPDFDGSLNPRCFPNGTMLVQPVQPGSSSFFRRQFQFTEPQCLSFFDSKMLLLDGSAGLGLYDISRPSTFSPTIDKHDEIKSIHSKTGVLSEKYAMVWGDDGLFLIDVSDPSNISQVLKIE